MVIVYNACYSILLVIHVVGVVLFKVMWVIVVLVIVALVYSSVSIQRC